MKQLGAIKMHDARNMSEGRLHLEIGKRSKYLKEELGMDKIECAIFISSMLNLGAALHEKIDKRMCGESKK